MDNTRLPVPGFARVPGLHLLISIAALNTDLFGRGDAMLGYDCSD